MRYLWKCGKRVEGKTLMISLVDKENGNVVMIVTLSKYASEKDLQWVMFRLKKLMEQFYLRVWSQKLRF